MNISNYEYGFITKCAEHGVDPDVLIKAAQESYSFPGADGKGSAGSAGSQEADDIFRKLNNIPDNVKSSLDDVARSNKLWKRLGLAGLGIGAGLLGANEYRKYSKEKAARERRKRVIKALILAGGVTAAGVGTAAAIKGGISGISSNSSSNSDK